MKRLLLPESMTFGEKGSGVSVFNSFNLYKGRRGIEGLQGFGEEIRECVSAILKPEAETRKPQP